MCAGRKTQSLVSANVVRLLEAADSPGSPLSVDVLLFVYDDSSWGGEVWTHRNNVVTIRAEGQMKYVIG